MAGVAVLAAAIPAGAIPACTAAAVIAADPGCSSGAGPCTITKTFEIGDGCVLDFGTREVTLGGSGELDIGPRVMTVKAGTFTIAGGLIDGRGDRLPGHTAVGGMVTIQATGDVAIRRSGSAVGQINVSADDDVGDILIESGGSVTITGRLDATSGRSFASGGTMTIRAQGTLIASAVSEILAIGGRESDGGLIDLYSAGSMTLSGRIAVSGGEGGIADVSSDADVSVQRIDATGVGDAGSGGCVTVTAGKSVQALGALTVNGTGSSSGFGGGCGGFLCLESRFGDVTIAGAIRGESGPPDGAGGEIQVLSRGSVDLRPGASISARGEGGQSCGGDICVDARRQVTIGGTLDTSGGGQGNDIDITAGLDLTVLPNVQLIAQGRQAGSFGGGIDLSAGLDVPGTLLLQGVLDASGGGCGMDLGCGGGGTIDLFGCNITLTSGGRLTTNGADGGGNFIAVREQLTMTGPVTSNRTVNSGLPGTNRIYRRSAGPAPVVGVVQPAAEILSLATCTTPFEPDCLASCPVCGNGVVEYPETCDNVAGPPLGCDGCSAVCQLEDCEDGLKCTVDVCDPVLGCSSTAVPSPCSETPLPTPTATATPTEAPSPTPTVTLALVPSSTPSSTVPPSATLTPTSTLTATSAPSATPTAPPVPTPTATARPRCVGDCNGDFRVTTDELVRCVQIALAASGAGCGAADASEDGAIGLDEIVMSVDNALGSCP